MKKDKSTNKKSNKALKIVLNAFFWSIIGFIAVWLVFNGIDKHTGYKLPFFGYRTSVIVSDSMGSVSPSNMSYITEDMKQIKKFDIITTKDYSSYEEIQKYDVLTYFSDGSLICHRVVDLYEDNGVQYIVTRGDANNINDDPIAYSLVRGKVVSQTDGGGKFILFFQSGYLWIALFGSAFFIALGMFIFNIKKEQKPAIENVEAPKEEIPVEEKPVEEATKEEPQPVEEAPKEEAPKQEEPVQEETK